MSKCGKNLEAFQRFTASVQECAQLSLWFEFCLFWCSVSVLHQIKLLTRAMSRKALQLSQKQPAVSKIFFAPNDSLITIFLRLNMLLILASLWWFCHTFVWKYHVTQLPFQLPWYAELHMEFPSPPFKPNYISILQTVQHWTGLWSCFSTISILFFKLLVYH